MLITYHESPTPFYSVSLIYHLPTHPPIYYLFIYPSFHPPIPLVMQHKLSTSTWTSSTSDCRAFQILQYWYTCQTSWGWDPSLHTSPFISFTPDYTHAWKWFYTAFSVSLHFDCDLAVMRPGVVSSTCGITTVLKRFQTLEALKMSA